MLLGLGGRYRDCGYQWDSSTEKSSVSDRDTTTMSFEKVSSVRPNISDGAIYVPLCGLICRLILICHMVREGI